MKKFHIRTILIALLSAVLSIGASPLFATVITLDVADGSGSGDQTFSTTDFWGVTFTSGTGFIQSVTLDLNSISAVARFDFDGSGSFSNATAPVIGALSGLTGGDIGFVTSDFPFTNNPQILTFNFVAGTFGVGDFFRFSADVDNFPTTAAGFVGTQIFSVLLENGSTGVGTFVDTTNQGFPTAAAAAVISEAPVPEPATAALLGLGLAMICFARKKKQI